MKIVGIMPLKLQNERLPGKNIMILGGKPLFRHSLDNLIESHCCDDIYIYCSDNIIEQLLPKGVCFLKRDSSLDLPTSNFNQIFDSFYKIIDADIYVYIHATSPYLTKDSIISCVEAVKSGEFDSAFCASKIQDFLWLDGKPMNFNSSNLPRSQDLKPIYREASSVYVFKKKTYMNLHSRVGIVPYIHEVNYKESVDINNREDFLLAEALLDIEL